MPLVSGLFKFLQHRSSLKESSISRHTAYAQPRLAVTINAASTAQIMERRDLMSDTAIKDATNYTPGGEGWCG